MTTELVVPEVRPLEPLKRTAAEIKADVNLIQQVLKSVFKKDVHFGVIPGTKKNTLYKPGAEYIMVIFRLCGEPIIEDLSTPDEIHYRIRIKVTHQITGATVGWGVGEGSSSEEKYKWKKAVLGEYNATPEDRRRLKYYDEGKPVMQVRANIADVANTVLKMTKKRALVDATLTCTAASDVFDQDLEDMTPEMREALIAKEQAKRPPMPTPTASIKQQPATAAAPQEEEEEQPARKINLAGARPMNAKFDAPCKICGEFIQTGMPMLYIGEGVDKGRYHVALRDA